MAEKTKTNKRGAGRPSVMTEKVLDLLKTAFLMGCSDDEACLYAEIDPKTLYNYQAKHPEYSTKKDLWKQHPILTARKTVINGLDTPENARWYLERKKKDEFSAKQEIGGSLDLPALTDLSKNVQKILSPQPAT